MTFPIDPRVSWTPLARAFPRGVFLGVCLVARMAFGAVAGDVRPDAAQVDFFEKKVRPLLAERCEKCHSAREGKAKGDLTLDTRSGWEKGGEHGPAIVPGKPAQSLLYQAILYTDDDVRMPPRTEGGKLGDDAIAVIRQWIADGAHDPRNGGGKRPTGLSPEARAHWAFQPVRKPTPPVPKDPSWAKNEIDAFVLARLEREGMRPNAMASREVLIRRVGYDLIGLPPTPAEVRAFVADPSTNAFEKVVDRLLASPHYGERWGRHWLDSARYSDTTGHGNDGAKRFQDYRYEYAWTYRDYVVRAFNDDKPWDQFLVEQLAADLLPDIGPQDPRLAALGFLTVGKRFDNPDDLVDERIDATGKAMLGLTVACARCHDHKFDPIPTADYYSWHGIFSNITEPLDSPELPGTADKEQRSAYERELEKLVARNRAAFQAFYRKRNPDFLRRAAGYLMVAAQKPRSPERKAIAQQYLLFPEDPEMMRGIRLANDHPVLGPFARLSKIPTNEFAAKAPGVLAAALSDRKAPVNALVAEALAGLKPRTLEDVALAYGRLMAPHAADATTLVNLRGKATGNTNLETAALTELVQTPFYVPTAAELETVEKQLEFMGGQSRRRPWQGAPQFERRTSDTFAFAQINQLRLTHPGAPGRAMLVADKPKPAESYIHIRGDRNKRGAVVPRRTLELIGGPDRKPYRIGSGRLELARSIVDPRDPLAARVAVNRVWMHHFGRGIVPTPDDLGTMSEPPDHRELLDYLAATFVADGWSVKRLHKRILLSAAYQQSGETRPDQEARDPDNRLVWRANTRRLDFEAIRDSLIWLSGTMDETVGGKPVNLTDEPYSHRRSVYGYIDRLRVSDLMSQFDFSDPEMPNSRRITTIVPQQALFFMNSPMTVDAARHLVNRSEVDDATDDDGRITALYQILYQRNPQARELAWGRGYIDDAHRLLYGSERPKGPRRTKVEYKKAKIQNNKYATLQNSGQTVQRGTLDAWESYAQALLCSDEFVYVY
jgi:hypothetical protein